MTRSKTTRTLLVLLALALSLSVGQAIAAKGGGGGKPGGGGGDPVVGDPAIAYIQDYRYSGYGPGELWVMDADGANQRKLLDEGIALPPRWNPEGTALVFGGDHVVGGHGIYVLRLQSDGSWAGPTKIVETWGMAFKLDWSPTAPDGKQYLAFEAFVDRDANGGSDDTDVFVVEVDLDGPVPVVYADGSGDALRVCDTEGHRERHPAWSADGTRLAFTRNSVDGEFESPHDLIVATFGFDGGIGLQGEVNLTEDLESASRPLDGLDIRQPCWARRSDDIVVLGATGSLPTYDTTALWLVPADAPEDAECLTGGLGSQEVVQPCWSPDDAQILYNGSTADYPSGALWLLESDGSAHELVGRSGKFRGGKYPPNRYNPAWKR